MGREDRRVRTGGTRQAVSAALILAVGLFFLPALVVRGEPVYQRAGAGELPNGELALPIAPMPPAEAAGARDRGRAVRLQTKEGDVVELTMADYLWGVVAEIGRAHV